MVQKQSQTNSMQEPEPLRFYNTSTELDESIDASGVRQGHWQQLVSNFETLTKKALTERSTKIQRILRDDGAIYNVNGGTSVWGLDPIPVVISPAEWQSIERGLVERAQLLDFVLKDIYNNQEIIRRGIVPPEVIYNHPGFIRACHRTHLPGSHQLIFYASDLVRGPDNQLMVVGDRTQAPSGSGYALENRLVMQRVFPVIFREQNVCRLRGFFNTLREQLLRLAPGRNLKSGESPRVVILTPGAYSETFFEHAFLANYLGYPLVQGKDLTVRRGYVWMKTLDGLSRVDVILRRVDDTYCDPVELKGDSQLGVAGLLEVVRAGRVAVANPLGSGILESGALMRYLPDISRHFFGRELSLPSAPTYWCGDSNDFNYVINNLRKLRIKHAHRQFDSNSTFGGSLSENELAALATSIRQSPQNYVAQEFVPPSQSPSWRNKNIEARPFALRAFAVANEQSYQIMPGGLTRSAANINDQLITNQLGAVSKDTWVPSLESDQEAQVTPSASLQPYRNIDVSLPSRVVENLFWVGRYNERADMALRLLRTVFMQLNGAHRLPVEAERLLLYSVTQLTMTYPGFNEASQTLFENPEGELMSVILDENRMGSVTASLKAMLRSASEVREMLSSDTQRVVNDIDDELYNLAKNLRASINSAPEEALDPMVTALLALAGLFNESMYRGMTWHFLELGRALEKVYQLTTLMRSLLVPVSQHEETQIVCTEVILTTTEGLNTFRRRFRNDTSLYNVLATLMLDRTNPRSLMYQLEYIGELIKELPNHNSNVPEIGRESRALLEAVSSIQLADISKLLEVNEQNSIRANLDQLLVRVQELMKSMALAISDVYFDHTAGPQQLVQNPWNMD
ncbi:circularly permuted type 2 ATP-grasp protein [Sessilibacter sp. MAH2]